MKKHGGMPICIECPNTIFHLYVKDETELSKLEIFMENIRYVEKLGIKDIYLWCKRHGIQFDSKFNYHKEFTISRTIRDYFRYSKEKARFMLGISFA